jgi:hypothetical protein
VNSLIAGPIEAAVAKYFHVHPTRKSKTGKKELDFENIGCEFLIDLVM